MKKFISLLLLAAITVTMLAGCGSTLGEDEKGATVQVYIGEEILDFDPALAYTNDSVAKVLGLVYEGLTRINEDGKVENALMKKYEIIEKPDKNEYSMQITLKNTKWSDGRVVAADDIVYAWKRILNPEFSCDAAALLYDIKNARDVKMGDVSIDDLGIAAIDQTVLEIRFEGKIDYKQFLENLASLALVPLREDVVERYAKEGESFGTKSSYMCSNGPFAVKGLNAGERLMLERNVYYYRNTEEDEALDAYVLPYRLNIDFTRDIDEVFTAYENEEIYYLSEIALSKREEYKKKAIKTDLLSTHAYIFNTNKTLFAHADTRRGLSMALDRNAIADIAVFAEPATGLIPKPVYDKKVGDSFRKNGGDILSANGDIDSAKSLILRTGKFTITCLDSHLEVAIAEYCKSVWEQLGFKVSIKALDADDYYEAYVEGDYDVIALDYQCLSTDSFGALAVFAPLFSGKGIDIQNDNYDAVPYINGYDSSAYNELIEKAFAEKNRSARSTILHEAEELLMSDMPIMPLIFNQDAYIYNKGIIKTIGDYYYGYRDFNRLNMKNWRDYEVTEEKTAVTP